LARSINAEPHLAFLHLGIGWDDDDVLMHAEVASSDIFVALR